MLVLEILMVVLLVLVTLPLLVLCIPLGYESQGRYCPEETRGWVTVTWGWGFLTCSLKHQRHGKPEITLSLAGFQLPLKNVKNRKESGPSTPATGKPPKGQTPPNEKPATHLHNRKAPVLLRHMRNHLTRETLKAVTGYLKDLLYRLKPSLFLANLAFGLDDPCQTAQLRNLMLSLWPVTNKWPLNVHPLFYPSPMEASFHLKGKLIPVTLLWTTLVFVLKKPVRAVWWSLLTQRKASYSTRKP